MTTKMPLAVPTLDLDNLGPLKEDLRPYPDDIHFWAAKHINQLILEFIEACKLLLALKGGGKFGTLQAAYDGQLAPPTSILLDTMRGGIDVRDASPAFASGTVLLGVRDTAGNNLWGLTSKGLLVRLGQDAIYSDPGSPISLRSGATGLTAFDLNTVADYSGLRIVRVLSQNLSAFEVWGGPTPAVVLAGAGSSIVKLRAEVESAPNLPVLRVVGFNSIGTVEKGAAVLPRVLSEGSIGTLNVPWGGMHANYFAGVKQFPSYAASVSIDAKAGELASILLGGDITISAITNFGPGQRLALVFTQDLSADHRLLGLPATVRLHGQVPFALSREPFDTDMLVLESDGSVFFEVGRYQKRPPERGITIRPALTNTDVTVTAHDDNHTQVITGPLTGPVDFFLSSTGAIDGDNFTVIAPEAAGVVTDATNKLRFLSDATVLLTFNESKTLKGEIGFVFAGGFWNVRSRHTYSYA